MTSTTQKPAVKKTPAKKTQSAKPKPAQKKATAPAPRPDSPYTKELRKTFAFPATAAAAEKMQKYLKSKAGKPVTRTHLAKVFKVSKPWVDRLLVLTGAKRLPEAVREGDRGRAADGFVLANRRKAS